MSISSQKRTGLKFRHYIYRGKKEVTAKPLLSVLNLLFIQTNRFKSLFLSAPLLSKLVVSDSPPV
jgi:hypothetical protein